MRWLELLLPRRRARSIVDIDLADLRARGIRGIALDLDNTLVAYGSRDIPDAVRAWVSRAQAAGCALVLVTNNRGRQARVLAETLGLPIAPGWAKPSASMFRRAMAMMGTGPAETALIGDQLLTDVLGGNRLGLYTILVSPLGGREFPTTRLVNRTLERLLFRLLGRREARAPRP